MPSSSAEKKRKRSSKKEEERKEEEEKVKDEDSEEEEIIREDDENSKKESKPKVVEKKPKKSSSSSSSHKQPPGCKVFTAENSSDRPGLCRVFVKTSPGGEKMELDQEDIEASPSFLALNDKGAKGFPVSVTPDTMSMLDSAVTAVVDKMILNAAFGLFNIEKLGLVTSASNGMIMHPDDAIAKGIKVNSKGQYVIKPRTVSIAIQMDEGLRKLFGDVRLPDDTRPPIVFESVEAAAIPATASQKSPASGGRGKKGAAASKKAAVTPTLPVKKNAAQESERALAKLLADYEIKV